MYCDLQSRGIKRKFVEEEDSLDQSQRLRSDGISRVNSTIVTKVNNFSTTKSNIQTTITSRILHHNLSLQHCYIRQRQQIFNISMCKLNRFRQSPDPSLLRSVLICNTLRTLERELEREGIKINFGPNGVSFIPPVLNTQNMTLDPPPSASSALVNQNHQPLEPSNYFQVSSRADTDSDNTNGEYDKYLLDLGSSSGRVTPFHKPLSGSGSVYEQESSSLESFASNSLSQSAANSAFWGSDEASDRLTSLNWSSVLNFNSSVNSTVNGINKSITNGHETNDNNESASSHQSSNSSNNNSNSTNSKSSTSFTTLLPPSTSSSTVTSTTTTTTTTASLSSTTLSSPSIPQNSIASQNSITSQNVINSQHVNHLSVNSGNSFSNNATNDEIFGDIDLSLYDFDLLSPLSPPNVKLAPITAEELIRTISPTDSNSSVVSSSTSSTSNSSSISTISSLSIASSASLLSGHAVHTSSSSSSSNTSGFHGRYFKSSDKLFSEERDQQAITPVMS